MEAAVRWSPFSAGNRERFLIVDVSTQSLSLNQVTSRKRNVLQHRLIARYERLPNFGAFDWSKTDESIVAVGLVSGSACLVKLQEDGSESTIVGTYKLKQERKCNSLALSTQDWLAVGLDKTRSDLCLNIYDVNRGLSTYPEPIRRLCSAEVVSSVRFFPRQPQELVVAAQRSFIRFYDLRDGYFSRNSTGNVQISTRNVNNIAIDPLDENYFASAGSTDDPTVTVWDKRWISQSTTSGSNSGPVFEFRPAVDNSARASVWSLRYSGQQRGRLAICASTGELKVVDMSEAHNSQLHSSDYLPINPYGGTPWSCNKYVSRIRSVIPPFRYDGPPNDADGQARLMAFDWMSFDNMTEQPLILLRRSRQIDLVHVPNSVPLSEVTARHDLAVKFNDVTITEPQKSPTAKTLVDLRPDSGTMEDNEQAEIMNEATTTVEASEEEKLYLNLDSPSLNTLFAHPAVQRDRCRQGYLFDCSKNREIVSGNWQLERLWTSIGWLQEQAAEHGMVHESLDLSFIGVSGVWRESIGVSPNRRIGSPSTKPGDAIVGLITTKEIPAFEGERTDFPEHRQLCLAICGWKFTTDSLEEECQELIDRGQYYQAIVQAVLHDYKHIALNLLRTLIRSKTIPNIGLGALLASDSINHEQREMCMWMAADTEDSALKALLTYLTSGDWRDVMKTNYLHLGYRMALGLKYLNDTELSGFIQSETARAVKNGDLEGILLTGLGEKSMDLLQTYLTRTNDLQTVVLAAAFTNPAYVEDLRWDMWRETYFMQMQSWRCFVERTKFVVQHNQMARTRDKQSLIKPPPSQITLRCNKCHATIGSQVQQGSKGSKSLTNRAIGAGIVCPKCGAHLPRCGICKMWLGMPDHANRPGRREKDNLGNILARFLTFCVNCEHGFHADHARSWFQKHEVCPVPNCECLCTVR